MIGPDTSEWVAKIYKLLKEKLRNMRRRNPWIGKKVGRPYIDEGVSLINKLIIKLSLPGWKDLLPIYTEQEIKAINDRLEDFQRMANNVVGGDAKFHPEIIQDLQRILAAEALSQHAQNLWRFSDQIPKNWRECVSTYLKAWAAHFDPLSLLELGELLIKSGYRSEAKDVFQVVLLFPTYADIFYAGQQKPDIVKSIVDAANESLQDLV